MENKEWYYINDIDNFIDSTRKLVFKLFGETNKETKDDDFVDILSEMTSDELSELDYTLTHEESEVIVKQYAKKQTSKKNNKVRYIINDDILNTIIEQLNSRMISNILNRLTNQGLLESAYDSEMNDFIFWVKDDKNDNKTSEKPETD